MNPLLLLALLGGAAYFVASSSAPAKPKEPTDCERAESMFALEMQRLNVAIATKTWTAISNSLAAYGELVKWAAKACPQFVPPALPYIPRLPNPGEKTEGGYIDPNKAPAGGYTDPIKAKCAELFKTFDARAQLLKYSLKNLDSQDMVKAAKDYVMQSSELAGINERMKDCGGAYGIISFAEAVQIPGMIQPDFKAYPETGLPGMPSAVRRGLSPLYQADNLTSSLTRKV
jgi:hypothetical protein